LIRIRFANPDPREPNQCGSGSEKIACSKKLLFLASQLKGDKNTVYLDSKLEKEVRGRLKSELIRLLSKETVLIADGLNYIKG
jgi:hypothetical protein